MLDIIFIIYTIYINSFFKGRQKIHCFKKGIQNFFRGAEERVQT